MPVIEITEKNKNLYQGKCVVLQSHIHDKKEVKPGEIVTKVGMDYFEALKCKLVRLYDPALDDKTENDKGQMSNELESSDVSLLTSDKKVTIDDPPEKIGRKTKKKK